MRRAVDLQITPASCALDAGRYGEIDPAQNGGIIACREGVHVSQVGLKEGGVVRAGKRTDIDGRIKSPVEDQAPPVDLVSHILPDVIPDLLQALVGGH